VKTLLASVLLLLLGAVHAPCQVRAAIDTSDQALEENPAGTRLHHVERVDNGVFKGSKPKSDSDYRFLESLQVRYIVDLQVLPLMTALEKRKAAQYGITVIPGIMNASPISPSEKHVDKILAILRDARYHPVYFHCRFGRDRTNVIAALYKMYFLGMSPEGAEQYLHDSGYGFKYGWLRSGLTRYLREHPTPPPNLVATSQAR
jgi:Tyrosine phosphatase family